MKHVVVSLAAALVLLSAGVVAAQSPDPSTTSTLPATASMLPVVGLGGLLALTAGLWLSRPRRSR